MQLGRTKETSARRSSARSRRIGRSRWSASYRVACTLMLDRDAFSSPSKFPLGGGGGPAPRLVGGRTRRQAADDNARLKCSTPSHIPATRTSIPTSLDKNTSMSCAKRLGGGGRATTLAPRAARRVVVCKAGWELQRTSSRRCVDRLAEDAQPQPLEHVRHAPGCRKPQHGTTRPPLQGHQAAPVAPLRHGEPTRAHDAVVAGLARRALPLHDAAFNLPTRSAETHLILRSWSSSVRSAAHHSRGLCARAWAAGTTSAPPGHHGTGMPAHVGSCRNQRITKAASPV